MEFTCPVCGAVVGCQTFTGKRPAVCPECNSRFNVLAEQTPHVPDAEDSPAEGTAANLPGETLCLTDSLNGSEAESNEEGDDSSIIETDIGEYVLIDQIGRGGMGVVYKARQKKLDRIVAVKLILGGRTVSREAIDEFIAEAQIAARLRHSNLVGVYGAGEYRGWVYFAMEYIEGGSLEDLLGEGPMPTAEAARLTAQVARAVAHLHQHGIVHCDLKPANILLGVDGTPFVTDFGLSREIQSPTCHLAEGTVAGTPLYMSPEQARGEVSGTGCASDVYSLGAIVYELLTGQAAFSGANESEVMNHVLGRSPVPPRTLLSSIPRSLEAICLKCLEKDPGDRYPSAAELADDLDRFLSNEPLAAHPLTPWRRFTGWVLREPALAVRIFAMVFLLFIELVWYHLLKISGLQFHRAVMIVLPWWAGACWLFQRLDHKGKRKYLVRLSWGIVDSACLTAILCSSVSGVCSPAVVCYFPLIAGAGLWHRVSMVRITAAVVMCSYGFLWLHTGLVNGRAAAGPYDRHIVFLAGLAILAFVVERLARRIQILQDRLRR